MHCTILNRNYPPGPGMTGHCANELAGYLRQRGVEVHVVTVEASYAGGAMPEGEVHGTVHRLPAVYDGKHKLRRLFSSLWEGRRMVRQARALGKGPFIVMSDPPLLNFWAARLLGGPRRPWIYWTMDLYPEAFCSAGLVSDGHPVYRWLHRQVYGRRPDALLALGPRQRDHLLGCYGDIARTAVLPAGVSRPQADPQRPPWAQGDKIVWGYVGNIGEAHDLEFVQETIRALDPARHRFILASYGVHGKRLREFARDYPVVEQFDSVPHGQMAYVDVHVITLKPRWDHVCVPSKAVSAVSGGGAILYHGSAGGDNWDLLQGAGWRIDPDKPRAEAVREAVAQITPEAVRGKRAQAAKIYAELVAMRDRAFEEMYGFVRELQP
jgi:hypothetical protein